MSQVRCMAEWWFRPVLDCSTVKNEAKGPAGPSPGVGEQLRWAGGGGGSKGIVPSTPTLGWQEGLWMAWLIWSKWWVVEREGGGVVGH